jgi:hypothetical protein
MNKGFVKNAGARRNDLRRCSRNNRRNDEGVSKVIEGFSVDGLPSEENASTSNNSVLLVIKFKI